MNICIWADAYGFCHSNDYLCPYFDTDDQMECEGFDDGDFHPEIKL